MRLFASPNSTINHSEFINAATFGDSRVSINAFAFTVRLTPHSQQTLRDASLTQQSPRRGAVNRSLRYRHGASDYRSEESDVPFP